MSHTITKALSWLHMLYMKAQYKYNAEEEKVTLTIEMTKTAYDQMRDFINRETK